MRELRMSGLVISGLLGCCLPHAAVAASACSIDGQPLKPLLELYTSEGCSSCPPADRWLSKQLQSTPITALVPLAWHVDYWDYIGWTDRFADPRFAQRQRTRANAAGERVVYTPQVMLGDEVRVDWRRLDWSAQAARLASRMPSMQLRLRAAQAGNGFDVELEALPGTDTDPRSLQLELVLYSDGLSSSVKAGENRNVELHHDHVVRSWHGPWPLSQAQQAPLRAHIPVPQEPGRALGVVAIVSDRTASDTRWALDLPLADCVSGDGGG